MTKMNLDAPEIVTQWFGLRGTMSVRLDENGLITREDMPEYIKHVFTARISRGVQIYEWHTFTNWDVQWDQYIGDPEQLKALYKLTDGGLPTELYQLQLLLQLVSKAVPKNGGAIDGPFALTTHASVDTAEKLTTYLGRLSREELNIVLHSSFVRTLKNL